MKFETSILLWFETELRGGQIKVAAACQQLGYLLFERNISRDLTHEWRPRCGICCLQAKWRLPERFVLLQSLKHKVFTHKVGEFWDAYSLITHVQTCFCKASQFCISAVDDDDTRFQSSQIGIKKNPEE